MANRGDVSERFEAGAHEHRARVALVDASLQELAVEPHRAERSAAGRTELEVRLERRLAPRAPRELDTVVGLEAGVGEGVDVPLAVVPLDVLVLTPWGLKT
jgi:hypothetical protein